jgi:hypothetical protein
MDVLTPEQMVARLDFMRPLKPEPEEPDSAWCIPFEYGGIAKGTKISISKAREIAAELRAAVAEAEKREFKRAFEQERDRASRALSQAAEYQQKFYVEQGRANIAEAQLRKLKRERRGNK